MLTSQKTDTNCTPRFVVHQFSTIDLLKKNENKLRKNLSQHQRKALLIPPNCTLSTYRRACTAQRCEESNRADAAPERNMVAKDKGDYESRVA